MYENSAATVREMTGRWERGARMTQPGEVERAMAAWRRERTARPAARWRGAVAKGLLALALRLDRAVTAVGGEQATVAAP